MEIKDKHFFKKAIRNKIDNYEKNFPFSFFMNILINLLFFLILIIIFALATAEANFIYGAYVVYLVLPFFAVMTVTLRGFVKNLKILYEIETGDYDFGIEDHEMDNAVEFIEDLPMGKAEAERLRKALSFDKLLDVLETADIIRYEHGNYDIDLSFKYAIISESGMDDFFDPPVKR